MPLNNTLIDQIPDDISFVIALLPLHWLFPSCRGF